jgi:hypothetical protein
MLVFDVVAWVMGSMINLSCDARFASDFFSFALLLPYCPAVYPSSSFTSLSFRLGCLGASRKAFVVLTVDDVLIMNLLAE